MADLPPIPARCADRPTIGGRVVPWINVPLADGGVDFRSQHTTRLREALHDQRCQVCSEPLTSPIVLLGGPTQLHQLLFDEPPLHPECAVYTSRACPVVAGEATSLPTGHRLSEGARGQRCFLEGCDCGGWVPTPGSAERRHPTEPHPWYAVYATGFNVAVSPTGELLGALLLPAQVRTVRLASRPGEGRSWTTVVDALADYEPPDMHPAGSAPQDHHRVRGERT